jgi:polysaccharide pyruvyl transferase WcaK-like protein
MILIIHAYSRGNSGDGLLVDLAIETVREAVGHEEPIVVSAMDPVSFGEMENVVPSAFGHGGQAKRACDAALLGAKLAGYYGLGLKFDLGALSRLMAEARLIVAVGGGYMRSATPFEGFKTLIAHTPVALAARWAGKPLIYLPQSVGPFRNALGAIVRKSLRGADHYFLRDDLSVKQIGFSEGVERAPDMAVMKLATTLPEGGNPRAYDWIYLVARDLDKSDDVKKAYYDNLQRLRALLPSAVPVVQSNVRGNNDAEFYKKIGWGGDYDLLKDAIAKNGRGVVISVRLHGSLQSLISGCPSVHLSYERKGFGAYEDLGIPEYVHVATGFDAELVANQAKSLAGDSSTFWGAVANSRDGILKARQRVVGTIAAVANQRLVSAL